MQTGREQVIELLKQRLAELDAELEATGLDNALDWEKFPEMERVLYALAERMTEQESERGESEEWRLSEFDAYGAEERDELLELVEMAEESALSELGAFGSAEPWFYGEPDMSWYGADNSKTVWSDERYLVGEEWDAWDAATDDIPERFFELDWSM